MQICFSAPGKHIHLEMSLLARVFQTSSGYPGWTKFLWDLQGESHVKGERFGVILGAGDYDMPLSYFTMILALHYSISNFRNVSDRDCAATGAINLFLLVFESTITTNFDKIV